METKARAFGPGLTKAYVLPGSTWMPFLLIQMEPPDVQKTEDSKKYCSTWGMYHFKTFDDRTFNFEGTCTYDFCLDCHSEFPAFHITIHRPTGGEGNIVYFTAKIMDVYIVVSSMGISVDGEDFMEYETRNGVEVKDTCENFEISAIDIKVIWNWADSLKVELDERYKKKVCGMCGNYDGDSTNDIQWKGYYAKSYVAADRTTDQATLPVCVNRGVVKGLLDQDMQHIQQHKRQSRGINIPYVLFGNLHKVNEPSEDCPDEVDNTPEQDTQKSSSICKDVDKCNCLVYLWPSTVQVDHCSFQKPDVQGTVLDDVNKQKKCVKQNLCPCSHKGNIYKPGGSYSAACQKCTCISGQWTCNQVACSGNCTLKGGSHIQTFDDKEYTFHGNCQYLMSKDTDNKFAIIAKIIQCGMTETVTCLNAVYINLLKMKIKICYCGNVYINNFLVALPKMTDTISIFKRSAFYIYVVTTFGLSVKVQVKPIFQLFISVNFSFQKKTLGLCGNFNGIEGDDLKTISGVVEDAVSAFGNSYKTQASCNNVPDFYDNPCSKSIFKEEFAKHWCFRLVNKHDVFAPCHEVLDPKPYQKHCIYDVCNSENSEEAMCSWLGEYANECRSQNVFLQNWRDNLCDPGCPETLVFTSSPRQCNFTCTSLAEPDTLCHITADPREGCSCPEGTYLTHDEKCVHPEDCPCSYKGRTVPAHQTFKIDDILCKCIRGILECPKGIEIGQACNPPMYYYDCKSHDPDKVGSQCQKSCTTQDMECYSNECVPGCMCPKGLVSNDKGDCIPPSKCPCLYGGKFHDTGTKINISCNTCTCENRKWECTKKHCPKTCTAYGNGHLITFDQYRTEFSGGCDYILAQHHFRALVHQAEKVLQCLHLPIAHKRLIETVKCGLSPFNPQAWVHLKLCPARWRIISAVCPVRMTRELLNEPQPVPGHNISSQAYIKHQRYLVGLYSDKIIKALEREPCLQDFCRNNKEDGTFQIIIQQIICGKTNSVCSLKIKITLLQTTIDIYEGRVEETSMHDSKQNDSSYSIVLMGEYIVFKTKDVILMYDQKITAMVQVSNATEGKVCGLCGDNDGRVANDFTSPWSRGCLPKGSRTESVCENNLEKLAWAQKQCNYIKSEVFASCHSSVDPSPFYDTCVADTCSCSNDIGDCECLCTSIAAYSTECRRHNFCIKWRTPDICPVFCDYYNKDDHCDWHYNPCGAPCIQTCLNPEGECEVQGEKLEGCYPTCKPERPYFDVEQQLCVNILNCSVCSESFSKLCDNETGECLCCYGGKTYRNGEALKEVINGQLCEFGYCMNGYMIMAKTKCGFPIPTTTASTPTWTPYTQILPTQTNTPTTEQYKYSASTLPYTNASTSVSERSSQSTTRKVPTMSGQSTKMVITGGKSTRRQTEETNAETSNLSASTQPAKQTVFYVRTLNKTSLQFVTSTSTTAKPPTTIPKVSPLFGKSTEMVITGGKSTREQRGTTSANTTNLSTSTQSTIQTSYSTTQLTEGTSSTPFSMSPVTTKTDCTLFSRPREITVGDCSAPHKVSVNYCGGRCATYSSYAPESGSKERYCSCCVDTEKSTKTVELKCPDGSTKTHTYDQIENCSFFQGVWYNFTQRINSSNMERSTEVAVLLGWDNLKGFIVVIVSLLRWSFQSEALPHIQLKMPCFVLRLKAGHLIENRIDLIIVNSACSVLS
ncbi:mucin-5B-like [Eleutherodactylus coqui]|uniref:mucin-5B-like n=1 Tax=Eleutherodactylus coqui TaxID=57060 RepID=UPI0034627E0A